MVTRQHRTRQCITRHRRATDAMLPGTRNAGADQCGDRHRRGTTGACKEGVSAPAANAPTAPTVRRRQRPTGASVCRYHQRQSMTASTMLRQGYQVLEERMTHWIRRAVIARLVATCPSSKREYGCLTCRPLHWRPRAASCRRAAQPLRQSTRRQSTRRHQRIWTSRLRSRVT